jgi:hypothetical protein
MMQQENGNDFVPDLAMAGALRRVRHLRQKNATDAPKKYNTLVIYLYYSH